MNKNFRQLRLIFRFKPKNFFETKQKFSLKDEVFAERGNYNKISQVYQGKNYRLTNAQVGEHENSC